MTKIVFDVNKSLEDCPPSFYPKGVHHKKRIVINRSKINCDRTLQSREDIYELENQSLIRQSYETFGFITENPPQCITESPLDGFEYDLICGFNRNAAQDSLGWETAIYDVLEFDTPLIKRAYCYQSNHIPAPRAANTQVDLLKGLDEAVKASELDRADDTAIKNFIELIAGDKPDPFRKILFKKFRARVSPHKTMQPLDSTKANELAEQLQIPHRGLKNNYGKIGFVVKKFHPFDWWNGMEYITNPNTDYNEVLVYGYVEAPDPSRLKAQRVKVLKSFEYVRNGVSKCLGHYGTELNGNFPFKFIGFLPQDMTPLPLLQGREKEIGLVDVDGDPVSKNY